MRLRILTYNIKDGGLGREAHILEVLKAAHPDVVVLEEVFEPASVKQWADSLDMSSVFARGNTRRHLALMSRFPIVSSNSFHPNPPLHTTLLEARLNLNHEQSVRVFGVHLLAQPLIVMEVWRFWEVATIVRRVKGTGDGPFFIVGDFNAIAPGDPVNTSAWPALLKLMLALQAGHVFRTAIGRVLAAGFFDCYRELHRDDPGFTLPASAPNARLDYVFANAEMRRGLRVCTIVREPTNVMAASDHCPLLAEFEL